MDNPIKEKLKKFFTKKNKEEKTSTPAAAPKEPKIVQIKKNLKGEEEQTEKKIMMPSMQNYYESDVEKAVKAQYKKAEEKNAELKKENLSAEELRKRGYTVRQTK
jgi:hypothetical protein